MKRALVTGGAGFLGSHLCERLIAEGMAVVAVDNLITGKRENVAHLLGRSDFELVLQDVSNPFEVAGPIDYVLHFASPASPIDYLELPIQTLKVGSLGTHNSLGLAKAKGARYLLASTSETYGDPLVHPQPETYWGNVNPVGPRGVYDEAKRFAEAMTMAYHRYHGLETRIVRIFNTYGPRMRPRDGTGRPGVHPAVAPRRTAHRLRRRQPDALVLLCRRPDRGHLPAPDVGGGPADQHRQPARDDDPAVRRAHPRASSAPRRRSTSARCPRTTPRPGSRTSPRRAALLGWEPKVDLDLGLGRTIDYFRSILPVAP